MVLNFEGKVVIVTGAGRGIGREIACTYAREGAKVLLADINKSEGEEVVRQIELEGGKAVFQETNVSKVEDIERLMAKAVSEFGTIDILINNAGVSRWKSLYEITVEEWDAILHTNLRGIFFCAREAAKIMRENGGGSIVNLASTRAFMSEPDTEAYAASKGGIVALTHAMAISLASDHIQVNSISPGWIETGDYGALRESDHKQHPSGRVGKPEDIARACLYLTSENNEFINGENLMIDGGMTRKMIYEP